MESPNEVDSDAVAEVVGGSLDGEVLPVGDPSVEWFVNRGLVYPVPGVKARVGEQENYRLSKSAAPDGTTVSRWVLKELYDRGVR